MPSKWVEHNNKKIMYLDFANFQANTRKFEAEITQTVTGIGQEMYAQPLHSVLVLVDLTNTEMTQRTQQLLSERITDTRKYVLKTAVVGMSGIRRMFLDFFSRLAGSSETAAFNDVETAKEWLTK